MKESNGARARSRDFGAVFRSFVWDSCGGRNWSPTANPRLPVKGGARCMQLYIYSVLHKRHRNAYGYGHRIYEPRTPRQEDEGDQKGRDGLPWSKGHLRRAGASSSTRRVQV